MDLSKLPRMSKTPTPEPAVEPPIAPAAPNQGVTPAAAAKPCPYCAAPLRAGARFCDNCGSPVRDYRDMGAGPAIEAWVSVGIGILLLIMCPTMTKFAASKVFHTTFAPYDATDESGTLIEGKRSDLVTMHYSATDGSETIKKIPYTLTKPDSNPNFWNDLAITFFALALIVEGVALVMSRKPFVVLFALLVTTIATLLNLGYVLETFRSYGFPLISGLAVIFGGYMMMYQFAMFQTVRRR